MPVFGKEELMNIGIRRQTQDFLVGDQLIELTKVTPNDGRETVSVEKFRAMLKAFADKQKGDARQ